MNFDELSFSLKVQNVYAHFIMLIIRLNKHENSLMRSSRRHWRSKHFILKFENTHLELFDNEGFEPLFLSER